MPIQSYVSQVFIHGVPYEETVAYGAAAVPVLIRVLRDPVQEAHWSNAVVMLAMIGDVKATEAVFEFIREPGPGEVTPARDWARRNGLMALGYSAHGGRNKPALQYLEGGLQPGAWQKRGVRGIDAAARAPGRQAESEPAPAPAKADEDEGSAAELLSHYAVLGLALSGTPEGRRAIEARRNKAGRPPQERGMLDSLLAEHEQIARKGVAGYDRERRERLPGPTGRPQGAPQARPGEAPPTPGTR